MVQDFGRAVDVAVALGGVGPGGRWNGQCSASLFADALAVWQLRCECELAPKTRRFHARTEHFVVPNAAAP